MEPEDFFNMFLKVFPPPPNGQGVFIWDGVERPAWLTPTGPNQVIGTGPNGELAFINQNALVCGVG